jgi:integrase
MKLTDQAVARLVLPAGKTDYIEADDEIGGFGVRLRAGGSKKWVYSYTVGSKQRRITLGSVKVLGATQARTTARNLAAKIRLGGDPAGERDEGRARAAETLGATAERFLSRQRARLRPGSYTECERHLLTHAKPLHGLQIGKVDRRAIAALLTEIGANRGPIAANRVRATLSALFAWAMKEGLADSNPTVATNSFAEQPRDRVLTDCELCAIWNALPQSDYGAILKLLMLTGQRLTEIADLRWSEIDSNKGLIRLPRERVKNNRPHEIPISALVREILAAQARRAGRDFVFGEGSRGFHGWSTPKIRLDEQIKIAPWRLHDIRRSVATHMAELSVQPHVIEQILNHQSGHKRGVAGIYNHSTYQNETRRALDLWAAHLGGLVGDRPSNIMPMRSA